LEFQVPKWGDYVDRLLFHAKVAKMKSDANETSHGVLVIPWLMV
jgi:hypothetical protein